MAKRKPVKSCKRGCKAVAPSADCPRLTKIYIDLRALVVKANSEWDAAQKKAKDLQAKLSALAAEMKSKGCKIPG